MKTLNIAHRGASSLAPENTLAAFDLALELGADGLEFDVQLTGDGEVVVIHDYDLGRTTSSRGMVNDLKLSDIALLDAGSWFDPAFTGAIVPTLDQVLARYRSDSILLNIELKRGTGGDPELEKQVIKTIEKHKLEEQVIISSDHYESLVSCRRLNPEIRTGMIYSFDMKEPWLRAHSLGCYSVHPLFFHLQSPGVVKGFKDQNLALYPWTVNDPETMSYLIGCGVEGIITDYPQELKKLLPA